VTFDSQGGTAVADGSFCTGGSVSAPVAPTRTGYVFDGWSATVGGVAVSFPYAPGVSANVTLYALWTASCYVVTFDSQGGAAVANGSFCTGGSVAAPVAPTRTGYTFGGWSATVGGSAVTFAYTPAVTHDITLYALWTANTYVITIDPVDGVEIPSIPYVTGGTITQPTLPNRPGYTLKGWSLIPGGTPVTFPYTPSVTGNFKIYPIWEAKYRTITLNASVFFAGDKYKLSAIEKAKLKALVAAVGSDALRKNIRIVATVKKAQSVVDGFVLAKQRAAVVVKYLKSLGLGGKFTIKAFGKGKVSADWARRAVVTITFEVLDTRS
jgi:uncharacterized repeat protein (TIGR02543 family)